MDSSLNFERYSRQLSLKGFGAEAQKKLTSAKVLVVGAGGLGCPALQYLVAAGVGTIGIVDDDVVSLSNLHRQVLYTMADIGLPKVHQAAIKLEALNPDVAIISYQSKLGKEAALTTIAQYDVVIDGTDNFASRYMINDACVLLNKPLVYGAVSQYDGQVGIFNVAGETSGATNYRDLFPQPPKDGEVLSCAEAGVLGVLPGIIGTMQAAEAIKLITGIGAPLINKILSYNLLHQQFYMVNVHPSPAGAVLLPKTESEFLEMDYNEATCTNERFAIEIDADKFKALHDKAGVTVIDVREAGEQPLITTFKHRQIPMSVFNERLSEIKEQEVILFCQHGIRSLHAAELLHERHGALKKIYSLKGGIVRWHTELVVKAAQ